MSRLARLQSEMQKTSTDTVLLPVGVDMPHFISYETLLEPGMVFSIEPGIYVPGSYGMRIEDIVIATADGHERFNNLDRSLVVVE